jgi:hypothetical protein
MKKIDRTENTEEIFDELRKLANNDMRIGQAFENIRSKYGNDLFNIENDKLLELFKEFTKPLNK